jgi:hypothetical protein
METTSFALGVGSVLIVLFGSIIVWLTLKVNKLVKENRSLKTDLSNIDRNIHQRLDNTDHHWSDGIKEVYNTIHHRVDEVYRIHKESHEAISREYEHLSEQLSKRFDDSLRYTDSRIDKLINNPKFCLNKEKELLTD